MKQRNKLRRINVISIAMLLLCGLNSNKATAQEWDHEYVPFVEEGKVWNCLLADNDEYNEDNPVYDCVFTMRGDTIIGERNYKKVYCEFDKHYGDNERHYYCAVREETYRVFIIEQEERTEKLLCDFSSPQEKLILYRGESLFGRSQGMHVRLDSTGPFIFYLMAIRDGEVNDNYGLGAAWVEGVGSVGNPFALEFYRDEPKLGSLIYVYSCMKDDEIIFEEWWTERPSEIRTPTIYTFHILYDLQGRPVKEMSTHGIYVKEGRKVIR